MRLIDADKLLEYVEKSAMKYIKKDLKVICDKVIEHGNFMKMVNEQPTAYDVDNAVAALEKLKGAAETLRTVDLEYRAYSEAAYQRGRIRAFNDAIEIVKRGKLNG